MSKNQLARPAVVGVSFLLLSPLAQAQYRSIDGTGNNLQDTDRGAAGSDIIRLGYLPEYPDSLGDAITAGSDLNSRTISNTLSAQTTDVFNDRGLSDWSVQWGQFITHDMDLTPTGSAFNVLSNGSTGDFNIPITDPTDILGPNAIPFNRSQFQAGTGDGTTINTPMGPQPIARVMTNEVTAYLDASMIYGSDTARAAALRSFSGGQLATSANGQLPAKNTDDLGNDDPFGLGSALYLAGDVRANEQVGLTATHALFVREHNRLATALAAADPSLTDEAIYQTARKIVGAEIQAITYNEYLPSLMGSDAPDPDAYDYRNNIDASITSSFAVAAFRFGHSMQSGDLDLVDNYGQTSSLSLANAFFDPTFLGDNPENVDLVLKGLATQTAQENDLLIDDSIRNFLFGPPGAGGMDLMALDIERARDHGLASMNALRQAYGLTLINQWSQVTSDPALIAQLTSLYGNTPIDADPMVIMLAEDHEAGSSIGELTTAILQSQFTRLRDGDRFFYTGDSELQSALIAGIIDIDSITLADIIELNTGITMLQDDVFFAADITAGMGDANADGLVNLLDLDILGQNWELTGKTYAEGDFNGDGVVNLLDLDLLGQNWEDGSTAFAAALAASLSVASVPEPSVAALLLLSSVIGRRRRSH